MFFKSHMVSSLSFSLSLFLSPPQPCPLSYRYSFFLPSLLFLSCYTARSINILPKMAWHADILSFLGSINKFFRSRASCPQSHSHSEWYLFTELSVWAVVAPNVYLQLVGASVKLFALLDGSISWTVVQETLEFCFSILWGASFIASDMKIYVLSSEEFKHRNLILWIFTQVV